MAFTLNFGTTNFPRLKTRRQKFGFGSFLGLVAFGAVFAGVGLFIYNSSKIDPSWARVSGQVVSVATSYSNNSTSYTPTVQYQVNGQVYKATSNIGSSSYPAVGSTEQVAYDPANPADAKVVAGGSVKLFALLFGGVGMLMILLAPVLYIKSLLRSRDIKGLTETGQKVQGVIVDIQMTNNSNVNYQNSRNSGPGSYKIVVAAPNLSGATQNFVSDAISGIGEITMANFRNQPIPIDVYINPANPQDYYVDISDIPSLTPERIGELIKSAAAGSQYQSVTGAQPMPAPTPTAFVPQPSVTPPNAPASPNEPNEPPPPQPL